MNVVTADVKLVRASSDENEDLFWGLRGGGGNFGIVTEIDYNLFPAGPEIAGGMVAWHASDDQQNIRWVREAWDDMKSFSTGGNYINFQTEDEGRDRINASLGRGLQQLAW